jgi:predicted HicB family RNase H-like nuclease
MTVDMTLRLPDHLAPSVRSAAQTAGLSMNEYVVRAVRRQSVLDAAQQLAALGLGDDLAGEGDTL